MRWPLKQRPRRRNGRRQVAVIGLGRFGSSLCESLQEQGVEVLGIDANPARTNALADKLTHVVNADTTDERALRQLGLTEFDDVVIAIGEDVQSSTFTALLLNDAGVERLWAKARNSYHARMLELIGVHRVVLPEHEMGERIARLISMDALLDYVDLTGEHSIAEIKVTGRFEGRTLRELDIRSRYSCNVVAIRRGEAVDITPDPDGPLRPDDVLVVIGRDADIARLRPRSR